VSQPDVADLGHVEQGQALREQLAVDDPFAKARDDPIPYAAGKLVKPDDILRVVREWNRTAKITIHCIAVGDACDVDFLKKLAAENYGDFVKR
jgi:hypothetical protein